MSDMKQYKLNPRVFNDAEALNLLEPMGFDVFSTGDGGFKLAKIEAQPLDSPIVVGSLYNIYCNKEWRNTHYNKNKSLFRKVLGLRYNMDNKPTMSKKFIGVLTNWRLEILDPLGEGILSVHSGDPFERNSYINSINVEQIAKDTINKLLVLNYIVLEDIQ